MFSEQGSKIDVSATKLRRQKIDHRLVRMNDKSDAFYYGIVIQTKKTTTGKCYPKSRLHESFCLGLFHKARDFSTLQDDWTNVTKSKLDAHIFNLIRTNEQAFVLLLMP